MHIGLKEYEKALEYLNSDHRRKPSDNLLYYYRGIVYEQIKQYQKAIVNYKKAVKKCQKKVDAYSKLAQIQYKIKKNYQKAQEYCYKALQIDQNHIQARLNLAKVYFSQESYQNAYKQFGVILELNPTSKKPLISHCHFYRGQIDHKQQKYQKAAQSFKSALIYSENHPIYLIKLVECYKRLNDVEALSETVDLCKKICSVGDQTKLLLEFELKQTDLEEIRAKIDQFDDQMQSYKQK